MDSFEGKSISPATYPLSREDFSAHDWNWMLAQTYVIPPDSQWEGEVDPCAYYYTCHDRLGGHRIERSKWDFVDPGERLQVPRRDSEMNDESQRMARARKKNPFHRKKLRAKTIGRADTTREEIIPPLNEKRRFFSIRFNTFVWNQVNF